MEASTETTDREAVAALVSDLHWQIDQMQPRGIKDKSGNPYTPGYYKRALAAAVSRGGTEVVDFVRGYLSKKPNEGFMKLEEADALDLTCEYLVTLEDKPYASLFTDADREKARKRLAPHMEAIAARKAGIQADIDARGSELSAKDLDELKALAAKADRAEDGVAINRRILELEPEDVVASNRLGRAYESLGRVDEAIGSFEKVLEVDPGNTIATRRVEELRRRRDRGQSL